MDNEDGFVADFLAETNDNLGRLDRDLVALERHAASPEALQSVLLVLHTIKGSCGFLGFSALEALAHAGEGLVCRIIDGTVPLGSESVGDLLELFDVVRGCLSRIEAEGAEGDRDDSAMIARLAAITGGAAILEGPPEGRAPQVLVDRRKGDAAAANSVRIDVGLLDRLLNLAGELVMARNRLNPLAEAGGDQEIVEALRCLDTIAAELQAGVMGARMQPITVLWNEFPRLVRDLAAACGRRVCISMEGQETEFDRAILDSLKDPLIHSIRNAIDHGIEPPEVRVAGGKPADGLLALRASYLEGHVRITIDDDGAGIDARKVGAKAVERGLIDAERASQLGPRELLELIFLPGFSTAERVTNVSGRGMGMDVVKAGVERAGGSLAIRSRPGIGTTLEMTIPLTMAILPSLIVGEGTGRYAIPRAGLLEVIRLAELGEVEWFQSPAVYRLRGKLVPLIDLGHILGGGDGCLPREPGEASLVILRVEGRGFGLVVGRVHDLEEIVVKPLPAILGPIPIYSGITILGDGTPTPILDLAAIARGSGILAEEPEGERTCATLADEREVSRTVLVLGIGTDDRRLAVPIGQVVRLEDVPLRSVDWVEGREVLGHQGRIIPLVRLGDAPEEGPLKVAVCTEGGRRIALVADKILDILEEPIWLLEADRPTNLLGVATIGGRVTGLLDIPAILRGADPTYFGSSEVELAMVGGVPA